MDLSSFSAIGASSVSTHSRAAFLVKLKNGMLTHAGKIPFVVEVSRMTELQTGQ